MSNLRFDLVSFRLLSCLAGAGLLVAACGPSSPKAPTAAEPAVAPAAPEPAATVDPGPDAADAFKWAMSHIESGAEITEMEAKQWFVPGFLTQVSLTDLNAGVKQISALKPFKVLSKEEKLPKSMTALLDSSQGGIRVDIAMNSAVPRQIEAISFRPAASEAPPKSYPDAVRILKDAGSDVMLSVSEIKKGVCTPGANFNATASLAIGSTFKLWVLAALNRKLARTKKASWDSKITIADALKSIGSGDLHGQAAGTELTIRELATKMISISDNTAADHLLDYVGRPAVEKMLKLSKHIAPESNIPFLSTRELFAMKLAATEAEVETYRNASTRAKRKFLAELGKRELKPAGGASWTKPKLLDIEWFANGPDLCNVMMTIAKQAKWDTSSEVLKAMSHNGGVEFDKAKWSYVGFKGGSELGVINLTFLLKRADNRWFVVTMSVNDQESAINAAAVVNVATGVLEILGSEK